jgi:dihydropteroate synthase
MVGLYLKPILEPAVGAGPDAVPLAGGALAFRMMEVIEGHDGPRRLVSAKEAQSAAPEIYQNLTRPRPAIAGLDFARPSVMGILNVTPDSFSDGDQWLDPDAAIAHGRTMAGAGAAIIDIGGESTRPGSTGTPAAEQLARILPVIEALAGERTPISVDTRDAGVMRGAVGAGAAIVNDISALRHDRDGAATVATLGVPVVLMHMRGKPADMMARADYGEVALEVYDELAQALEAACAGGIDPAKIIIDPGIGFAKRPEHSLAILRDLALFHGLGHALLVGGSRKGFTGHFNAGGTAGGNRLGGSLMAMTWALNGGAQILRVHDVAESRQALDLWLATVG